MYRQRTFEIFRGETMKTKQQNLEGHDPLELNGIEGSK